MTRFSRRMICRRRKAKMTPYRPCRVRMNRLSSDLISLSSDIAEEPAKYYINGNPVSILAERIEYLDENGKLVTESLRDYSKKTLRKHFASLDDFLKRWNSDGRKQAIIEELENEGCCLVRWLMKWAKTLTPLTLSAMLPLISRRLPGASGPTMSASAISLLNMALRPAPCLRPYCRNTRMKASPALTI